MEEQKSVTHHSRYMHLRKACTLKSALSPGQNSHSCDCCVIGSSTCEAISHSAFIAPFAESNFVKWLVVRYDTIRCVVEEPPKEPSTATSALLARSIALPSEGRL